jgi:iron complex outermembrane receptor protein
MRFSHRQRFRWSLSCVLVFAGLFVSQGFAAPSGSLIARIFDKETQTPLPGTNLQILETVRGGSAGPDGMVRVSGIPTGVYNIRVSMMGYRSRILESIHISASDTTRIECALEETTIETDPIVVLAGKTKQTLDESTVSLSVVSAQDIQQRNPVDLVQALETAPGVHFIGNQINIRGSTGYTFGAGNKVLLLLDGVPVYASDTGEFNWDMLPPMDIKQIEVLKGAGSTLWGASALGGVVNIITRDPAPEGRLHISTTAGKYDDPYYDQWKWTDHSRLMYTRTDISYSKQINRLGFRLSAGRLSSTGYTELGDALKYNLTAKVDYRFENGIRWQGYAAYSHVRRGFFVQWKGQNDPYEVDPGNLDNRATTNQINAYSKISVPLSPHLGLNVRASVVRTLMGNQFGPDAGFKPAVGQGAELQIDYLPSPDHTVTTGIQFQLDAGSTEYFGDHRGYFISPYLQDEWDLRENLKLTGGMRYDRYQLENGPKEDLFSPRLGLHWTPWPTTHVRGSVGSGFRAATIVERFLELTVMNFKILANPDLKSESSWAYEVGVKQYVTPDWSIDISLFNTEYWELIEAHLDLIRGQIQFRNIPRARIRGLEATTTFTHPVRLWGRDWIPGLEASTTVMEHKDLRWDEPLTYRPDILATVKASLQSGRVRFEADYRYASKIDEVKVYPINERVPMKFVDIRGSLKFGNITLQAGVNNLFQYNYSPMESNLMPMRTVTVGLRGRF